MVAEREAIYAIVDWNENFETAETRKRTQPMPWLRIRTKWGDGYRWLVHGHANGLAHLGAWLAICQLSCRMKKRGVLVQDRGSPHDAASISLRTGGSPDLIAEALERLCDERCGWMMRIHAGDDQEDTGREVGGPQEGTGTPQAETGTQVAETGRSLGYQTGDVRPKTPDSVLRKEREHRAEPRRSRGGSRSGKDGDPRIRELSARWIDRYAEAAGEKQPSFNYGAWGRLCKAALKEHEPDEIERRFARFFASQRGRMSAWRFESFFRDIALYSTDAQAVAAPPTIRPEDYASPEECEGMNR